MRPVVRLLSALAALAALSTGSLAHAADAPPKAFTKEQIAQGKKEAPAVMATTGIPCTVVDAGFIGQSVPKGADGKPGKPQSVYEVACQGAMGYAILADPAGGKATAYDCLQTATGAGGSLICRLPENADPKQGLVPIAAAAGHPCSPVSAARTIGTTPAGESFYELRCGAAPGFVLQVASAASGTPPKAIDCAQTVGKGQLECTLTSAAEIAAAQKAVVDGLVAKAGRPCQVSGTRTIGALTNGQTAYEVACGPSGGFILMADRAGAVAQTIDCAKADNIAGGCTLTNAAEAKTAENGVYARLAKASGYNCDVNKYRLVGQDGTKSEVVELACANRPDGAVAIFPADNGRAKIYDCVQAGALQQRCQFSDPKAVYVKYNAALAAKGRTSCKVSNARWLGRYTQANSDLIETACADGNPGWVMEVADGSNQIKDLLSCGQAKAAGVSCALPGNVK